MSALRYALRELAFRRSRSVIAVLSFAVAVLAAMLLTALAASYARAIRAPIETVGADVIVQITGDIPPKLEGLVFPHPNALVPAAAVAAIAKMAGVIAVTRAVYMWELAPDHYQSVLGIDDGEAGLGALLGSRLIDGKDAAESIARSCSTAISPARRHQGGHTIDVGGTKFPVAGIVDAARGGKVVRADVYMPLAPRSARRSPRRWCRRSIRSAATMPIGCWSRSNARISKASSTRSGRCSAKKGSCRANCRSARRSAACCSCRSAWA